VFGGKTIHKLHALPVLRVRGHEDHIRPGHGRETHGLVWIARLTHHPGGLRVEMAPDVRSMHVIRIH
jgi:hypothetical protein